ncbi:hypothetical protein LITTLEE_28 [Mycobacterium phage LittleE]|uniref:Uncharacterized protein n=1 Tax=Mycobacterium phage LittleE TaxID=2922212 RepID=G1D3R3_9CAUD|nr:hypothetical protein FGG27_gp028 [Mycobacterium phage LittleE]AEK09412.1 hypothetical protein LITTLEE_28 [Mycobacterium phage LittleE]ASZ74103.1 hypothetical protein SEA_SQUINT_27 [Mycobacterium phage Squint]
MAKYRTLTAGAYVNGGKVVSFEANRIIELTDAQAAKLGDKVERSQVNDSMFPDGAPIIPAGFVPEAAAPVVEEEAEEKAPAAPKFKFAKTK